MHLVAIKFDRVFDIVQDPSGRGAYPTLFSFESAGKRYFSVSISGAPRLESGMEVIAALAHRDDWKSLEGWKDVQTGTIHLPRLTSVASPLYRTAPILLGCLVGFLHYESYWYLAGAVLLSCLSLVPIAAIVRLRKARLALERT